jgi:hypothetical protein
MSDEPHPNWKLLLRYGRLKTPYEHFAVVADVQVIESDAELGSQVGPAWLAIAVWARSADAAADLVRAIAPEMGAEVRGRVYVYESPPVEPPRDDPFAYGPRFKAYELRVGTQTIQECLDAGLLDEIHIDLSALG